MYSNICIFITLNDHKQKYRHLRMFQVIRMCDTDDMVDDSTNYTVVDLDGYTLYNVSVAANTIIGTGPSLVDVTATAHSGE